MTDQISVTALPATPVRYRFVSVHRIVGFSELRQSPDLLTVLDLPLNLDLPEVSAYLTMDPNPPLTEVDRGAAVGHMMLQGFAGQRTAGDTLAAVHERAADYAKERLKASGIPGVYLVLEGNGNLVTTPTEVARDLGGAILAFDSVDKRALMENFAPLVSAALAGVVLNVDTTSDVSLVSHGISVTLPDGRPLYSVTITAGNASLVTSRPATDKDAGKIERAITALIGNQRLVTPSRLLVDALRSTGDRLEAFIFAWAALEMTIRKYTSGCENGKWIDGVREQDHSTATELHHAYVKGGHQHYSLAARTQVFALTHQMGSGNEFANEISRLRKAYREPLYHEGAIVQQLPVEAVIGLASKFMKAVVKCD